ncbi:hypothetical protein KP509_09G065800 [Ceratopteris richardii]|uniref:RING-type E3 ubiquitin transferase n=1 Tax=Ceratopteris richardii TaxID=49495 RepID=A0A8T2U782_CERRI|nr:hypothetical protein KP509_09G065800 [Ceratopteris richardii]
MSRDPRSHYYCYHCERTVQLVSPGTLICGDCHGDFIEERPGQLLPSEESASSESRANEVDYMGLGCGQLLEDMSNFLSSMLVTHAAASAIESINEEVPRGSSLHTDGHPMDHILVLQGRIQNLLNLYQRDHVITGNREHPRPSGAVGDYYIGPGLEHLIQHLTENDPGKYGTPPASMAAVDSLPTIRVAKEHLCTDAVQCAVCKDEFEHLCQVKQLPCNHIYHPDCIVPWLKQHNSCPVCRYELPTDDPDYELSRTRRLRVGETARLTGAGYFSGEQRARRGLSFQSSPSQPPVDEGYHAQQQTNFSITLEDGTENMVSHDSNVIRRFSSSASWIQSSSRTQYPVPPRTDSNIVNNLSRLSNTVSSLSTLSNGVVGDGNSRREQIIRGSSNFSSNNLHATRSDSREEGLG